MVWKKNWSSWNLSMVSGHVDTIVSANVNGEINEQNGATGYSIEVFVPYYEMKLEEAPSKIGLLVAFNNIDNREDTGRTWFSHKV